MLACRQRVELEELRQQLEENSAALTRSLRAEFERSREEQERRHQVSALSPSECQLSPAVELGSLFCLTHVVWGPQLGGQGLGMASGPSQSYSPQMELKALKDQLEAERQAWVASCAKKEVGLDRALAAGRHSELCGALVGHCMLLTAHTWIQNG